MLDIALLRKDIAAVAARLKARPFDLDIEAFNALEGERRSVQMRTEELQAKRNALSKQVGLLKGRGEDASAVLAEVAAIPEQVKALEGQLSNIQLRLQTYMLNIPNVPHEYAVWSMPMRRCPPSPLHPWWPSKRWSCWDAR